MCLCSHTRGEYTGIEAAKNYIWHWIIYHDCHYHRNRNLSNTQMKQTPILTICWYRLMQNFFLLVSVVPLWWWFCASVGEGVLQFISWYAHNRAGCPTLFKDTFKVTCLHLNLAVLFVIVTWYFPLCDCRWRQSSMELSSNHNNRTNALAAISVVHFVFSRTPVNDYWMNGQILQLERQHIHLQLLYSCMLFTPMIFSVTNAYLVYNPQF